MNQEKRLSLSLLGLRLSVFLVMLMWTLDKFTNPDHAARIFSKFYAIDGLGTSLIVILGAVELLLLLAFVLGLARRFTFGAVLLLHAGSTFSSWQQYLNPSEGNNLLFFAAWPMFAACVALYLLRDSDRFTLGGKRLGAKL